MTARHASASEAEMPQTHRESRPEKVRYCLSRASRTFGAGMFLFGLLGWSTSAAAKESVRQSGEVRQRVHEARRERAVRKKRHANKSALQTKSPAGPDPKAQVLQVSGQTIDSSAASSSKASNKHPSKTHTNMPSWVVGLRSRPEPSKQDSARQVKKTKTWWKAGNPEVDEATASPFTPVPKNTTAKASGKKAGATTGAKPLRQMKAAAAASSKKAASEADSSSTPETQPTSQARKHGAQPQTQKRESKKVSWWRPSTIARKVKEASQRLWYVAPSRAESD